MLRIYNTLAREKQEFVPIRPGEVRMYVCGMTVYDYCHIGHGRMMVAFDLIRRWLRASGYRVTYVRNITDIDDKIIQRAAENCETIAELTARNIRYMDEDVGALGVEKPDHEPRATQYVPQMLEMIRRLEANGLAYKAADGDVNFSVRKFPGYGKLSGKLLDDLRAGVRVEVGAAKRDPLDFVLWKHSKPEEPKWPSPWGEGRPGWAIECSAMGCSLLGDSFDIHGGGQDLQFPHHENEIAQSEGANGKPFVRYWLHNGFVQVDDTKMSKSLGNFFTIREVLKAFDPEVVRFFLVRAHYRSELSYSETQLNDAKAGLTRLYGALMTSSPLEESVDWEEPHAVRFKAAMDDDFNTPEAVAELHRLANLVYHGDNKLVPQLRSLGRVLGLLQRPAREFFQGGVVNAKFEPMTATGTGTQYTNDRIEEMIAIRLEARKARDFIKADQVRDELEAVGIVLEDGPKGTTWRRA